MSDWAYITIAYALAWGGVALYALALARRVIGARRLERRLRETLDGQLPVSAPWSEDRPGWMDEGNRSACDVPPAP